MRNHLQFDLIMDASRFGTKIVSIEVTSDLDFNKGGCVIQI